jgi:hypothetical protein
MTLDDDLRQQFERCGTLEELKPAVRATLARHGQESSDRMVRAVLIGFFGGTVVRVDAQGQPLNPWRRKFFPSEAAQPAQRHAA